MKLSTVIVGLLLAFLLFTPQGHFVGEAVMLKAVEASKPAPDPVKIAAEKACEEAFYAKQKASSQKAEEAAKRSLIPGFDPNGANHYKYAPPPC
jgi:hypothetical protein